MKKRLVTLAALALLAIAGSTAIAYGHGAGGFHGGASGWHGGYYGGGHGYYGGWRGAYWGPGVGLYLGGPAYWGGWPYAYSYPYGYGYAPYASYAVTSPTVYVEQQIDESTPPAQSSPSPPTAQGNPTPPPTFWFYCTKPAGYYPYVRNCSKAWLPVLPQANTGTRTRPKLAQ